MPILKQLVSNSAHSKRRSRADLTAEMISAPLGDFRHTMHVGRAGDAFGDTSFLTSKAGEPGPDCPRASPPAPSSAPTDGAGMKHAESIMSFHIDLGPSMLGDVLSIMDKDSPHFLGTFCRPSASSPMLCWALAPHPWDGWMDGAIPDA
uniref:CDC42 effector protein 4 n=1 Tax=Falco tinnunculus TaxID=100819 RepID=A0A8C4TPS2_FALTI